MDMNDLSERFTEWFGSRLVTNIILFLILLQL